MTGLTGIEFLEILALNATVHMAPSPTAHAPEWFSELLFPSDFFTPRLSNCSGLSWDGHLPRPLPQSQTLTSPATVT